jgi:hypothetical protein
MLSCWTFLRDSVFLYFTGLLVAALLLLSSFQSVFLIENCAVRNNWLFWSLVCKGRSEMIKYGVLISCLSCSLVETSNTVQLHMSQGHFVFAKIPIYPYSISFPYRLFLIIHIIIQLHTNNFIWPVTRWWASFTSFLNSVTLTFTHAHKNWELLARAVVFFIDSVFYFIVCQQYIYSVMYATYYMYIIYIWPVGISNIIIVLFLKH